MLELKAAATQVYLAPSLGGAIASAYTEALGERVQWLVAAPDNPVACFPMVPFPSRVRHGAFTFGDQQVALLCNDPPHAIHGHGWQTDWSVVHATATQAVIAMTYAADRHWPWTYRVQQRFELEPHRLHVGMELCNESSTPMPAGLGWHPYFPAHPNAQLTANVAREWVMDDEGMPSYNVAPRTDLATGLRVYNATLDTVFTGWDQRATLCWPGWQVHISAAGPLATLVVYSPDQAEFVCVEPLSQMTDGFNRLARGEAEHGVTVLQAGATMQANMQLEVAKVAAHS